MIKPVFGICDQRLEVSDLTFWQRTTKLLSDQTAALVFHMTFINRFSHDMTQMKIIHNHIRSKTMCVVQVTLPILKC